MALIKVRDLAWPRMHAPDLDAMEEFLTHFGLTRAARTPTALYTRPVPWGSAGGRRAPIAIGTLDGAPLEQRVPVTALALAGQGGKYSPPTLK